MLAVAALRGGDGGGWRRVGAAMIVIMALMAHGYNLMMTAW